MSDEIQAIATNNYLLATPIGSGYMETSALEYDGDKISGYSGSAFKAGDEFPQSATDAIEAVTANSGIWGGSALPISAGPGIKIELVDNTLVFRNDETILWSTATPAAVTSFTLSESANLFEKIEVHYQHVDPPYMSNVLLFDGNSSAISIYGFQNGDRTIWLSNTDYKTTNYINYTKQRSWNIGIGQSTESTQKQKISKIIGINRITGGN